MLLYKVKEKIDILLLLSIRDNGAIDNDEDSFIHGKPEICLFYNPVSVLFILWTNTKLTAQFFIQF